jgi:uncharacterized protein YyaL (SSP411 family)
MIALLLLAGATGEERYRDEAREILTFLATHLLADGQVRHHWVDGEAARETDETYYCSGCNLQLLYVMWGLEQRSL